MRYPSQKPIRFDRVLLAVLFLAALVVVPILAVRSCNRGERADDGLVIVDNGSTTIGDTTAVTDDETTVDDSIVADADGENTLPSIEDQIVRHTVADGETIGDIAALLGVTSANLLASNRLFGSGQLRPGQNLYASQDGIVHSILPGQTLSDIARSYAIPLETLLDANDIRTTDTIFAGDRILIPGVTTSFWDNAVQLSRGRETEFIWPLEAEVVSEFGYRIHPVLGNRHHHDGIDLDVPEGTAVYASRSGEVTFYGEQPGYGNLLIIDHGDRFYSLYGHLSDAFAFVGQFVEMGQAIAQSGNTGISSGPHLHFEIRNGEYPIDPLRYLP